MINRNTRNILLSSFFGLAISVAMFILVPRENILAQEWYCTLDAPYWHFNSWPQCYNYGTPRHWRYCTFSAPIVETKRLDYYTVRVTVINTTPCSNKNRGITVYRNKRRIKILPPGGGSFIDSSAPANISYTYSAANFDGYLNCGCSPLAGSDYVPSAAENRAPSVSLSASPTSGIVPLSVTATFSVSDPDDNLASWTLSCGNGTTYTGSSPGNYSRRCRYTSPGDYTISLTAKDVLGKSSSRSVTVSVLPPANTPPSITLLYPPRGAWFSSNRIDLTAKPTDPDGDRVRVCFDLRGDGSCDYTSPFSPSGSIVRYTATLSDGTYSWRAKAIDEKGAESGWSPVWSFGIDTTPPSATLQPKTATIKEGESVTFSLRATDSGSGISSWSLNCGNGTIFQGSGSPPNRRVCTYARAGVYTVVLSVSDRVGHVGSDSARITVNTIQPPNRPPTANIGCSPSSCEVVRGDRLVLLNNSFDPDGIGDIKSSVWEILGTGITFNCPSNDRVCDFTPQPTLTPGTYTARLTVRDSKNQTSSATRQFRILRDISANFECSLDEGRSYRACNNLQVAVNQKLYIRDLSRPSEGARLTFRRFEFQDGNPRVSSSPTVVVVFTSGGSKRITLTVRDSRGRTATKSDVIINVIIPIPRWREIEPF